LSQRRYQAVRAISDCLAPSGVRNPRAIPTDRTRAVEQPSSMSPTPRRSEVPSEITTVSPPASLRETETTS
jgi:hypothetical protein